MSLLYIHDYSCLFRHASTACMHSWYSCIHANKYAQYIVCRNTNIHTYIQASKSTGPDTINPRLLKRRVRNCQTRWMYLKWRWNTIMLLPVTWYQGPLESYLVVSINGGTPRSSILIGFSLVNHPAIGVPPWLWNPPHVASHHLVDCLAMTTVDLHLAGNLVRDSWMYKGLQEYMELS